MMRLPETSVPIALAAALALAGCEAPMAPAPQVPQQGGYPPGQLGPQAYPQQPQQPYAPGGYTPGPYLTPGGQPSPQPYAPGPYMTPQPQAYPAAPFPQPAPQPPQASPPAQPPQAPAFPFPIPFLQPAAAAGDPINNVDLNYLRETARSVLGELVAALPSARQAKVQGIPFVPDAKVGDVNAYASCDESHMPRMSVTDGLLQIEAYIAQLKAIDELYGTQKLDAYLTMFAREQKPRQPIVAPQAGLIEPAQHVDPRKVARQHQLLEEQLAFVLGHELGHHYLGHTGCANGQSGDRNLNLGDLGRVLTKVVPVANQPVEMDADNAGVDDLLAAGARRQGYHWTETGAILTLGFFARMHDITPESTLLFWLNDHPFPQQRLPLIRQEANRFRQTGTWATPFVPVVG